MQTTPAIILVRPQMGENIGAAARVMSNFGLSDLRLVSPRDGWPNEKAIAMAAHGEAVVQQARLFASVAEAVADCRYVFATTATRRDMPKPTLRPREAVAQCHANTAILFGPERAGLENEDLVLADAIIEIPTDAANSSLNLAQAVCVICYEWYNQKDSVQPHGGSQDLCTREELQGFFDHLEGALEMRGYFRVAHKKPLMWQHLRSLFVKARLSEQEVRTLRGVVKALTMQAPDHRSE